MEIIRLPVGEVAPEDSDCVHVEPNGSGTFVINCSALGGKGDGEAEESVAVIGSDPYDTYEEAEAAGIAWAEGQCVSELYISRAA